MAHFLEDCPFQDIKFRTRGNFYALNLILVYSLWLLFFVIFIPTLLYFWISYFFLYFLISYHCFCSISWTNFPQIYRKLLEVLERCDLRNFAFRSNSMLKLRVMLRLYPRFIQIKDSAICNALVSVPIGRSFEIRHILKYLSNLSYSEILIEDEISFELFVWFTSFGTGKRCKKEWFNAGENCRVIQLGHRSPPRHKSSFIDIPYSISRCLISNSLSSRSFPSAPSSSLSFVQPCVRWLRVVAVAHCQNASRVNDSHKAARALRHWR